MALPGRPHAGKTAGDLVEWLASEVGPRLSEETEVIAHGGTALTLLGLKGSTKDVDLGFRTREYLDRFVRALEELGYRRIADMRSRPTEIFLRFRSPGHVIDLVDLRYPTWNNWRLTEALLRGAVVLRFGTLRLVRLDPEAIFLFKTYPLRDADLEDLRGVIDRASVDQARVIALFDEQDGLHRADLAREDIEHEPLFNILQLRVRFAGSCDLLGARYRAAVPRIARHAREKFRELRLRRTLPRLVSLLRDPDRLVDWDEIVGGDADGLRARLGGDRAGPG